MYCYIKLNSPFFEGYFYNLIKMRYQWKLYFNKHKGRKPKQQLLDALQYVKNKDLALDLGCGLMIESKAMIKNGFKKVVAVDNYKGLKSFIKPDKNIDFRLTGFHKFEFPLDSFDLINAEFALSFYGKEGFDKFWKNIVKSLKVGGIFTGQLFGVKDSWNTKDSKMVFHTKLKVLKMFEEFDLILFEEKYDPNSSSSTQKLKAWHIFRFIARKK